MDLGDFFVCQTVNLSFAIATNQFNGLSNFSPEVTVEIFDGPLSGRTGFIYYPARSK